MLLSLFLNTSKHKTPELELLVHPSNPSCSPVGTIDSQLLLKRGWRTFSLVAISILTTRRRDSRQISERLILLLFIVQLYSGSGMFVIDCSIIVSWVLTKASVLDPFSFFSSDLSVFHPSFLVK